MVKKSTPNQISLSTSEIVLKMGKKGERIYTIKEIRAKDGPQGGSEAESNLKPRWKKTGHRTIRSLEEVLKRKPLFNMSPEDAEKVSEREQKRQRAYGPSSK
jgi:hypothetical protein